MISQTKTTQRDPARGAVVGGLVGAVFLGTILAVQFWLTYNKMNDGFGFGIVAAVVLPIWGSIIGAVIGALIGAVAVHTARIIGQRMIGSLIPMIRSFLRQ